MQLKTILSLAAVASLFCGCVTDNTCDSKRIQPVEYVVFVGLDGLSSRSVTRVKPPTFQRLMREGAWTLESRSMLPSASSCNWHSLFTCAASEQHGYIAWNSQKPAFKPSALNENGVFPDVFSELKKQKPEETSAFIYEWGGMQYTVDTNAIAKIVRTKNPAETEKATAEAIASKKYRFIAAVSDAPDGDGHRHGWDSPEYDKRVMALDAWVGKVIEQIERAGIADRTVLVVSSDHGGEAKGHGRATLNDMERPVFIWGPNVRKGYKLGFGGTIYDTGATLAALLGIDFHHAWIGRPFTEAFER